MVPIIGLSGRAGAGKDFTAAILKDHGYVRYAFADLLKEEVEQALRCGLRPCTRSLSEELVYAFFMVAHAGESTKEKPYSDDMRRLLQLWGTEYRRSMCGEDYWVRAMESRLPDAGSVVITDVRFPNEAEFIKSRGGQMWRIERDLPPSSADAHISEHAMDGYGFDAVIDNNGTAEDLASRVTAIMDGRHVRHDSSDALEEKCQKMPS